MSGMETAGKRARAVIPVTAILIVNAVSVIGQIIFWRAHLPWPFLAVIGFAIALESLAVFTSYYASLAELSRDTSLKLRMVSYGLGLTVGLLNGSHYFRNGHVTAASAGMFLLSASSPFLWSTHSRRVSRDALKAAGIIDDKAVRLGMRWIFFPRDSLAVYKLAIWHGINNPADALAKWESVNAVKIAVAEAERDALTLDKASTQADAVRVAIRELGETASTADVVTWLSERGRDVAPARVRQVRADDAKAVASARRSSVRALPSGQRTESGR